MIFHYMDFWWIFNSRTFTKGNNWECPNLEFLKCSRNWKKVFLSFGGSNVFLRLKFSEIWPPEVLRFFDFAWSYIMAFEKKKIRLIANRLCWRDLRARGRKWVTLFRKYKEKLGFGIGGTHLKLFSKHVIFSQILYTHFKPEKTVSIWKLWNLRFSVSSREVEGFANSKKMNTKVRIEIRKLTRVENICSTYNYRLHLWNRKRGLRKRTILLVGRHLPRWSQWQLFMGCW